MVMIVNVMVIGVVVTLQTVHLRVVVVVSVVLGVVRVVWDSLQENYHQ